MKPENVLILVFSLILIFHLMIVSGLVPYDMVWGGRLENREQMLGFESVSIALNLLLLGIVLVKSGRLKIEIQPKILRVCFWIMGGLFALNTLGNLLSNNLWEAIIFSPLTLVLSFYSFKIAARGF